MKVKKTTDGSWSYLCPCGDYHTLNSTWKFNDDTDKPTFTPSVLVRCGHYISGFDPKKDNCRCKYNRQHPDEKGFNCYVCHSYVKDGVVEFLQDCTHKFAGQKVPLPEWPHP